jgi:hypothetical protein
MNFILGLAAFPIKNLSLPAHLSFLLEEGRGRGEEAQGQELRAQGKPPALLFQIFLVEFHFEILISLISPILEPDYLSL